MNAAQIHSLSCNARAVHDGAAAGLALLDETQLAKVQALADDAQTIAELCSAYLLASQECNALREVLASLNDFNVFDFDPCTIEELTTVKDRASELVAKFPEG